MAQVIAERQPDESTTGRHLPALDGIRGIAILLVLVFHLFAGNDHPKSSELIVYLAQLRAACWVGVDLFFVLSGFLITGILYDTQSGRHYFRNFYARRVLRIFPLYYGTLAVVAIAVLLTGCRLLPGFWILVAYLASIVGAPYATCGWLNLNHFWTLSLEELFYLVWPTVIFLAKRPRTIVLVALVASLFSIGLRAYLVLSGHAVNNPYIVYAFAPARLDSLLAGGMLAVGLRTRFRDEILRVAPFALGLGLLALAALLVKHPTLPWDGGLAWSVGLYDLLAITFSALIATALRESKTKRALSVSALRFFGRYSYGMYVFHVILSGIFDARLRASIHAWSGSLLVSVVLTGLILAAMTTLLAVASYRLYEQRWLLLKRHFEDHTRAPKLSELAS